jgi:uncharacterized protein (TIGR03083 family)
MTQPRIPIETIHLFPKLDEELISLLRSLTPEQWHAPTLARKWLVKDIAAHLLDGNMRHISINRDKHLVPPSNPINSYKDLVDFLNELNAVWVNAFKRVSTELLIELLESTASEYNKAMLALDPFADSVFSVGWAGEEVSKNWFHIAREYTEKFHHQQQIREATGHPSLLSRELYYPFIDTFMQALPYTYRNVEAEAGTVIQITVTTDAGGDWFLHRAGNAWLLSKQHPSPVHASIAMDPDLAWKLFTKGIDGDTAKQRVVINGKKELAEPVLRMVSVMA